MTAAGRAPSGDAIDQIDQAVDGLADKLVLLRRDIHAHPELAWQEVRTSALVARELTQAGLTPTPLPRGTGLTCDIMGDPAGPMVAFRADLDALPVNDEKDVPYRSSTPGVAHACGHDVHTAVVLGAGLTLSRLAGAGALAGSVRLIFQPAEEVLPGGALAAIEAGALDGVDRVFALHCDPRVEVGKVAVRSGAITAASDLVIVGLSGPGGHTARPQLTVDIVGALADVLVRTSTLLSRRVDPRAGLSVVWGRVAAGSAPNVIPEHGEASGSVRVLDRATWDDLADLIPELIKEIAAPYRARVDVSYLRGVPPAVNDPQATEAFRAAAVAALGGDGMQDTPQSMGAEDFARMLDRVPGVLARLGVRAAGVPDAPDLHRGDFDVDEKAIGYGIRVMVSAALGALADPALRP